MKIPVNILRNSCIKQCGIVILTLTLLSGVSHGRDFTNYPTYGTLPVENWPQAEQYESLLGDLTWSHHAVAERCAAVGISTNNFCPSPTGTRRPKQDIQMIQEKIESVIASGAWVVTNKMGESGDYNQWFNQEVITDCWYRVEEVHYPATTNQYVICLILPGQEWVNETEYTADIVRDDFPYDTVATVSPGSSWTNTYSYEGDVTNYVPASTNIVTNLVLLAEGVIIGDTSEAWKCWKWENDWVVLEKGTNWYEYEYITNIIPASTNFTDSVGLYKTFQAKVEIITEPYTWTNYICLGLEATQGDVQLPVINTPYSFPVETKGGLFYRAGIGIVSNTSKDAFGFVTNGNADWTKVQYTNGTVEYGYAPYRLTEKALEECRRAASVLRFTQRPVSWTSPFRRNAGNEFVGSAIEAQPNASFNWGVLEDQAEDNWHRWKKISSLPQIWTWKDDYCFCVAWAVVENGLISGLSTNYAHSAQFYAVSTFYGYWLAERSDVKLQYDPYGTPLVQDKYQKWNSTIVSRSDNMLSMDYLGSTNLPSPWCSNPTLENHIQTRGFYVTNGIGLIKWDVEGGFSYK